MLIIIRRKTRIHKNIRPRKGRCNSANISHRARTNPPHKLIAIAPKSPRPEFFLFPLKTSIKRAIPIPNNTAHKILFERVVLVGAGLPYTDLKSNNNKQNPIIK